MSGPENLNRGGLVHTDRHQHQAAVGNDGVLAGGQQDELIAVVDGNAGIVDSQVPNALDELLVLGLVGKIVEEVVREALAGVAGGAEHADHLVGVALIKGVEIDHLVGVKEALAGVLEHMGEHVAVEHAVAVEGQHVGGLKYIAGLPDVNGAVLIVIFVEIPVQIVVLLILALHHGVVDVGAGDVDPANQILVHLVNACQLRQNAVGIVRLIRHRGTIHRAGGIGRQGGNDGRGGPGVVNAGISRIRGPGSGLGAVLVGRGLAQGRRGPGGGIGVHLLQILQLLPVLNGVNDIFAQGKGAEDKNHGKQRNQYPIKNFFQGKAPPVRDYLHYKPSGPESKA